MSWKSPSVSIQHTQRGNGLVYIQEIYNRFSQCERQLVQTHTTGRAENSQSTRRNCKPEREKTLLQ